MLITIASESFAEIGPAILESIGNKVQETHPPYMYLTAPPWIKFVDI